MADLATAALFVLGAVFILLAAVGMVRMPDVFLRMSCSTKAATLGIVGCMTGAALAFGELGIAARGLAGVAFLTVSMPVGAQVIGRAAYLLGVPLWHGTVADALRGRYDRARGALR